MFQHVHSSKYLDYVLAARVDQMARCYGMAMEEFLQLGLAWFQRSAHIEYKRPLRMSDQFKVTTWIDGMDKDTVAVGFEIRRSESQKLCCDGRCEYTLVNVATGRAEAIPESIATKYAV
jgi:YbgC/YbaW family acyl-CoA thioester hydrolase